MARPESRINLMHVPTPDEVIDSIAELFVIPGGSNILDPCCGTGHAVTRLAGTSGCGTYGIELSVDRAADAAGMMTRVLPCAMQDAVVSHGAFGLVLLNPPYDDSVEGRLETKFLKRCTNYTATGGYIILIVKVPMLAKMEYLLATDFDIVGCYRFPHPYFDGPELAFRQSVCILKRRSHRDLSRNYRNYAGSRISPWSMKDLPTSFDSKLIVPNTRAPDRFLSGAISDEDCVKLLGESPVSRKMEMPSLIKSGRPPLPLKQAHIAQVLASGSVDGIYGSGEELCVARGTVTRSTRHEVEYTETSHGNPVTIEKETDSFTIEVRAIDSHGTIHDVGSTMVAAGSGGDS